MVLASSQSLYFGEGEEMQTDQDNPSPVETGRGREWMSPEFETGLVSVIIPAFNRADLMSETLDSVWAQTFRPIEVLVVDDGSKEDVRGVVDSWRSTHPETAEFRVHYFRQQNVGAPVARNHGLRKSRGEYIQFLDNDDLLGETKLEKQVRMLREQAPNVAVYSPAQIFFRNGARYVLRKSTTPTDERTLRGWLSGGAILPHCLLWQRADLCELGPWREDLAANQDGEYAMRFLVRGGRMLHCPATRVFYRHQIGHGDSISHARTHATHQSRLAVLGSIERELIARDAVEAHSDALACAYMRLAVTVAPDSPDILAVCYGRFLQLSAKSSFRDLFPLHHWMLYRLFGLKYGAMLLAKLKSCKMVFLIHRMPGITLADRAVDLYRE